MSSPATTSTSGAPGGSTTTPLCFNASNPLQVIPCTPKPPEQTFTDKWLWTIILAAVVFLLCLTCGILSYWKYSKKKEVFEEREAKRKKRLEDKFKRELLEKKRQHDLERANRLNAMEQL